jgi:hypothetical protein
MSAAKLLVKVEEITEGDRFLSPTGFHHWTALTDAEVKGRIVTVMVQFSDGGVTPRAWEAGTEIEVERQS